MDNASEKLWRIIDKFRSDRNRGILPIIQEARKQGMFIEETDFRVLASIQGAIFEEMPLPTYVVSFITELLEGEPIDSIIDPWTGYGFSLLQLTKALKPKKAIGLTQKSTGYEAARLLDVNNLIEWRFGNPFTILDETTEQFDLILGSLTFRNKAVIEKLNAPEGVIELNDEMNIIAFVKAATLLKQNGYGIFVGRGFLKSYGENATAYKSLSHLDLYVEAILSVPQWAFGQYSGSPYLIVVRKGEHRDIFVGKIMDDAASRAALLKNLKKRKQGQEPELGVLIEPDLFRSVDQTIIDWKISRLSKIAGLSEKKLANIAVVNMPKHSKHAEGFKEEQNSVYLPLIGNSEAVLSIDSFRIEPHNYAQIVLDSKAAIAPYVAQFYNSDLGMIIRKRHTSGFIPKLSKERLTESSVYLPSMEIQIEAVHTQSLISDMETQLEINKHRLLNNPRQAKEIYNAIKALNQENAFEAWLESLPFPLASILWEYNTELNAKDKTTHLLQFFEALAEFLTLISLSAFSSNRQIYKKYSATWIDEGENHEKSFLHASFGNWVILGDNIAKQMRILLENEENKELCLSLFGKPEDQFVQMVANKAIYTSLREACGFRNSWIGHAGIDSPKIWNERLILAEAVLAKIRKYIADSFENMPLIAPVNNEFEKGIYHFQVLSLMGSRTIFKKSIVDTFSPMDKQRLYLLSKDQHQPLELLPLVRMRASPGEAQNACYFYNRVENKQVRWVSYHFQPVSEFFEVPDHEVLQALSLFRKQNGDETDLHS